MAVSLSPQLKQAIHNPLLVPGNHQSYSTPRHFTTVVHHKHDLEVLSISSTESSFKSPASSQVLPDLPSWTPLKPLGEDEGSDHEADQFSAKPAKATGSAMKRLRKSPHLSVENTATTATAISTSKPSSGTRPVKRARFDGVFITAKPPSAYKKHRPKSKRPSTTWGTSLVDALTRTFHANRHTTDLSSRPSRSRDDASRAVQTEVETSDPEEDLLHLNSRLVRRPLKRPFSRINDFNSASVSETSSEDITPLRQDIPLPDRPIKHIKAIPYALNVAAIDAALGTVRAPISWDHELDFMTRDDDFIMSPVRAALTPSLDDQTTVDEGNHTTAPCRKAFLPTGHVSAPPPGAEHPKAVFSPYLSRAAQFQQRLDAMFGVDMAVRTDRTARARRVEFDFFAFDEPDREPSPAPSDSSVSVTPVSTGEEAGVAPSIHITSESPDVLPADGICVVQPSPVTKQVHVAGEEQMSTWIAALQRLVKGKVHVTEEDLETLSITLAEIESLKDSLCNVSLIPELRECIKQLSELRDIPFGDRNMLRQRAKNISQTWPPLMEVKPS